MFFLFFNQQFMNFESILTLEGLAVNELESSLSWVFDDIIASDI